jgi:hypothetical protein
MPTLTVSDNRVDDEPLVRVSAMDIEPGTVFECNLGGGGVFLRTGSMSIVALQHPFCTWSASSVHDCPPIHGYREVVASLRIVENA